VAKRKKKLGLLDWAIYPYKMFLFRSISHLQSTFTWLNRPLQLSSGQVLCEHSFPSSYFFLCPFIYSTSLLNGSVFNPFWSSLPFDWLITFTIITDTVGWCLPPSPVTYLSHLFVPSDSFLSFFWISQVCWMFLLLCC
jgi:hypothetical protein